jgi:hypothetical protein
MIPLLVMAAGAAAGMAGAKRKEAEAARRENFNSAAGANDTRFSPFVAGRTQQLAPSDPGPGLLGGGLSGALAGLQQGTNLKGLDVFKGGMDKVSDALNIKTDIGGLNTGKKPTLFDANKYAVNPMPSFDQNAYAPQAFYAGR